MHLPFSKRNTLFVALSLAMLSGCSSSGNVAEATKDYRDTQADVVKPLDMPPNLINPGHARGHLATALEKIQQKPKTEQKQTIPTFAADGLSIRSNLSERWLEIDSQNSDEVWQGLKRFFTNAGFAIAEERKEIGILKTDFEPRQELVPADAMGPITRMLNSWRPELAEGIYDRYTVRVETDEAAGKTRIYFSHTELYSPEVNERKGMEDRWRIKPYNPIMESQALYELMVFLGSSSEKALAQLQVSEAMLELVEGEEFERLALRAGMESSWNYLQAMIYRANWDVTEVNTALHKVTIVVPETVRKEESFFEKLAFWQDERMDALPEQVSLRLIAVKENNEQTYLEVASLEGEEPLNAQQRRYLFENLGLLVK